MTRAHPTSESERPSNEEPLSKRSLPWLQAAFSALMKEGIGAVRVERLASSLDVTKGSFYHHFKNREALLEAMRGTWAEQGTASIIKKVEGPGGSAAEKLLRLMQEIFAPSDVDALEGAIREWAAVEEKTASMLRQIDTRRLEYVQHLLQASGLSPTLATLRAHILYRVVIGDFAWRRVAGPILDDHSIRELAAMLLRGESAGPAAGAPLVDK